MLTGDKVETATCIAMSAGFKSRGQQLFFIKECTSVRECDVAISQFSQNAEKLVLMIDGQSLDIILGGAKTVEDAEKKHSTLE